MREPLKLKSTKPLSFEELMWMCKHFEIEDVDKNNVITFSGEVTVSSDWRMMYAEAEE